MPSVCSSGVPRLRSGIAPQVVIEPNYLQSILPIQMWWLSPFLPLLGPITLDLSVFCTLEPVAEPTQAELLEAAVNIISGNPLLIAAGAYTITAALHYRAWFTFCECSAGTPPTPATPIAAPSDLPVFNPSGQVNTPLVPPCVAVDTGSVVVGTGATYSRGGPDGTGRNVTYTQARMQTTIQSSTGQNVDFKFYKEKATSPIDKTLVQTYSLGPAMSFTGTLPYDVTHPVMWLDVFGAGGSGNSNALCVTEMFCDYTLPTDREQPCCPPDPIAQAQLGQILAMVTLLQRQSAPFAYVPGASHTALSDDGSISVSGLIGVAVDITTLPSHYGVEDGTPLQLFDLGYITLGTADGWVESRRVTHDGYVWFPPQVGLYTLIGYTFNPGVVATIKELVREP